MPASDILRVDEVYVINLDRRTDRWYTISRRMAAIGIQPTRIAAVDGLAILPEYMSGSVDRNTIRSPGAYGALRSHAAVLRDAKLRGYQKIAVFEDDVAFHVDFINRIAVLDSMADWLSVNLGAYQTNWNALPPSNSGTYLSRATHGSFATLLDWRIFDELLELYSAERYQVENVSPICLQNRYFGQFFTIFPNLCVTNPSDSDVRVQASKVAFARIMMWDLEQYQTDIEEPPQPEPPQPEQPPQPEPPQPPQPEPPQPEPPQPHTKPNVLPTRLVNDIEVLICSGKYDELVSAECTKHCKVSARIVDPTKPIWSEASHVLIFDSNVCPTAETDITRLQEFLRHDFQPGIAGGYWAKGALFPSRTTNWSGTGRLTWGLVDWPVVWGMYNCNHIGGMKPANIFNISNTHGTSLCRALVLNTKNDLNGWKYKRSKMLASLPNIMVLGVGHSGTSVLTRMLGRLGWDLGDADGDFAESVSIRALNNRLLSEQINDEVLRSALVALRQPWVIKDPRFTMTLDRWYGAFINQPPVLIHIVRDLEAVKASYKRRNEMLANRPGMYGHTVEELVDFSNQQFAQWPWSKFQLQFENMSAAVAVFDTLRAAN